jgi:hypothetical protein
MVFEKVICSNCIMERWERISKDIPQEYEQYSLELLAKVAELWVTIRGHSFAKDWNMKFERKYQKGTRKALKPEKQSSEK